MKKIICVVFLFLSSGIVFAQELDEERMNRDLEIAKNVIGTLLKGESDMFLGSSSIEASYVSGYGVIFTIPRHYSMMWVRPPRPAPTPHIRIRSRGTGDEVILYEGNVNAMVKETEEIARKQQELLKKQQELYNMQQKLSAEEQKELQKIQEEMTKQQEKLAEAVAEIEIDEKELAKIAEEAEIQALAWGSEYSENMEAVMQKTEQAIITFLADYADLIGQLKPTDHIMVKQESLHDEFLVGIGNDATWSEYPGSSADEGKERKSGFSAEVSKKDISDYKAGKFTFEAFRERITIKRAEPERTSPDLDMFASIFKQYYGPKLSKTFFTETTPRYEILDNFGVIYTIRTYSSYAEGDIYYMPVLGKEKVSSEERKSKIEELYPKFEKDLKAFIIDYARTIRSLDDDDQLLLKIGLTKCEECAIPKSIDVSVRMSVLNQYDQQKISRDKALAAIEIKKNFDADIF